MAAAEHALCDPPGSDFVVRAANVLYDLMRVLFSMSLMRVASDVSHILSYVCSHRLFWRSDISDQYVKISPDPKSSRPLDLHRSCSGSKTSTPPDLSL